MQKLTTFDLLWKFCLKDLQFEITITVVFIPSTSIIADKKKNTGEIFLINLNYIRAKFGDPDFVMFFC